MHVDVFDQQHHDQHEACDHQGMFQDTNEHGYFSLA
jgi:hypothetical protein